MDDGYYYHRDRIAYIYLPPYSSDEFNLLLDNLQSSFSLSPILKKKKGGWCLIFKVEDTRKLVNLIRPHIIPSLAYKLPFDPVSTQA